MSHTRANLRTLVVLPFAPDLEGSAAARCAVALLQGLRAQAVDCRVLAVETPISQPPVYSGIQIEFMSTDSSRWRRRWNRLMNPGRAVASGRFAERLRQLAVGVDVVHLVDPRMAGALRMFDCPTVLQLDCLSARDRKIRRLWARAERDALEVLRSERHALRRANWLLVNSQEVAEVLPRRIAQSHRAVAPLALDPAHYTMQASLERPVAGLIGTARWPTTTNAVRRLLSRVWPRVLERRPTARLVLAGVGMEAATFGADPDLPGVEWRGRVPSATDFLRELGVLLYPLTAGSGTKVKVLEALALGVPVVSTREGAEGLIDRRGVMVDRGRHGGAARRRSRPARRWRSGA